MRLLEVLLVFGLLGALAMSVGAQEATEKKEPWKHETAKVNGIKLHYVTMGKGPVILFLHGFPEFWYAWKDQIPFFGKEYQAVAADMRGYNLSDKPEKVEDYAIPLLIADIKALLDHLSKGKKAILVAHDWGGAIAWTYAAMHPETLEKLVIINAPHPNVFGRELEKNPKQQQASGYMNFFRSAEAEQLLMANDFALLVSGVFGSASKPDAFTAEDKRRYKEAWGRPGALTGGLNYYRAAKLGPPSQEAKAEAGKAEKPALTQLPELKIPMPTLVIWGEKDTALLTGNLDGLDKYVPNLTLKRIPNGSHWVVHEAPELINTTIQEFLKKK
jgi:epoxide hydrolase 4